MILQWERTTILHSENRTLTLNRDSVLTLFHGNNNAENNKLYLSENKALSSFLSKQEFWALLLFSTLVRLRSTENRAV